jgi:hypothetical protein
VKILGVKIPPPPIKTLDEVLAEDDDEQREAEG